MKRRRTRMAGDDRDAISLFRETIMQEGGDSLRNHKTSCFQNTASKHRPGLRFIWHVFHGGRRTHNRESFFLFRV